MKVTATARLAYNVSHWLSVIGLLLHLEFQRKYRHSAIGSLVALAEPFLLVAGVVLVRAVFLQRIPTYGGSSALFTASGVFPYYIFMRLSARSRTVRYDAFGRLPRISTTDLMIARLALEALVFTWVTLVFFMAMDLFGVQGSDPVDSWVALQAIGLAIGLGVGIGLVNSGITRRFPLWAMAYGLLSRAFIFASGVFYIVDSLPYFSRQYIVWNPLAHIIEWFRLGVYGPLYPHATFDPQYALAWVLGSLLVGIIMFLATIRMEYRTY
jgi:capsular polysaccharide transport system permease protein